MTIRTDLTIDWEVSPRIITVASPSTEATVQDIYDTCMSLEAESGAIEDPHIIDAAGKECFLLLIHFLLFLFTHGSS